ncbi:DJ-1/PfpI family protein [Halorientalis pallida]|uniref:DJ-1/PfpI family protein n=1 Tax=Halorientalis pallida TaxID=2479928 RepID=UPI003C6EEE67
MEIAILLFEGFDELDAIGPFEVFENAADAGADCETTLRSLEGTSPVTASHGLDVGVDGPLDEADPDLLVVPGGGWNDRDGPGAYREAERGAVPEAIAAHRERGGSVAGVCTGGLLLARAGALDGRPAVTHASALEDLRATEAEVVDARVVDDGDVLTAGGVTSGLDLAVHLVEREFGAEVAAAVRTEMEYEPRGRVHTA